MYRLLIVDDEAYITDGLYEIISNALDIDIYKAYSGSEALDIFKRGRFDIVLTDIQMPGMSGLQLADHLRAAQPMCRIIFLTGHHEFQYVYSAIQHERVNYILKTEGYDKIIETIKQAIHAAEQQFISNEMLAYAEEQQTKEVHYLRQQFINDLLQENICSSEATPELFQQLDMPITATQPVFMLLGAIKQLPKSLTYAEKKRFTYSLEWIAQSYFQHFTMNYMVSIHNHRLLWLFQPLEEKPRQAHAFVEEAPSTSTLPATATSISISTSSATDMDPATIAVKPSTTQDKWHQLQHTLQEHLDQLQQAFLQATSIEISLVLDHSASVWSKLAERYEQLNVLFYYRIGNGDTQLIISSDMANSEQQQLMNKTHVKPLKVEQLGLTLQNGQAHEFSTLLEELLPAMLHASSDHYAEEVYLSIALIYFSYINRWNLSKQLAEKIRLQRLLHFSMHSTRDEAASYLEQLGKALLSQQNQSEKERAVQIITKLQTYIHEHLHNPDKTSLMHLAQTTFFNASYLSRLFKQVTGVNLSDFINEARIDQAKQLLSAPHLKIQDVAEQVGYSNATNFTRFFRKLTGMTPQEYRAHLVH